MEGYSDGSCSKGRGGWGAVLFYPGGVIYTDHGGKSGTTNQEMELTGLLKCLRLVVHPPREGVTVWSDSTYCLSGVVDGGKDGVVTSRRSVNGWVRGWESRGWVTASGAPVKHVELWKQLTKECLRIGAVCPLRLRWVKGHSGVEGNELADRLAVLGREEGRR